MTKKKFVVGCFIIFSLILICFAYVKYYSLNLKPSIVPLNKKALNFSNSANNFYEPRPSNTSSLAKIPPWLNYKPVYTINSDSLNERFEYAFKKPPKTSRIIVLGDSWSFGIWVDTVQNYTEILEELLNKNPLCSGVKKIEVINLGVPGYDIQYEVERYKKRGIKYQPDLVIWEIGQGNFERMEDLIIEKSQNGKSFNDVNNEIHKTIGKEKMFLYQYSFLKSFRQYYGGKLLFYSFITNSTREQINDYILREAHAILLESKIDFNKGGNFLPYDYHPNQKGHKEMAYEIYNYLRSHKEILCK